MTKRLLTIAALLALAAPTAFAAPPAGKGNPNAAQNAATNATPPPAKVCALQRKQLGAANFLALWLAKNSGQAMKACAAGQVQAQNGDAKNAAKYCKEQRNVLGTSTFNESYGENANDKNAFGKCVSAKARDLTLTQLTETLKAAKACKQLRSSDAGAFATAYGTKKNAFGKCVSKKP